MVSDLSLQANNGTLSVNKEKKSPMSARAKLATLGYHYEVTAGRLNRLTHGPKPTPCLHVQENEADTIINFNCGLEDQTTEHNYNAEMPACAERPEN